MAKDELTTGDERPDGTTDGSSKKAIHVPVEIFDQISAEFFRSAITEDPARTARSIADYRTVSHAFENSVIRNSEGNSPARTRTRQFITRLGRLGAMAKQVHEKAFPEEGLSSTDFDVPGSASTRIEAAGGLIAFQSEERQAKLVKDILDITTPSERMNAIARLTKKSTRDQTDGRVSNSPFEQLGLKYQKPLIDEVFRAHIEESRVDGIFIGETPTADIIVNMEKQLQPEHLQKLGAMLFTHPEKLKEIADEKARHLESAREGASPRPIDQPHYGPKQQIDRHIDDLEERVRNLKPIEDLGDMGFEDPAHGAGWEQIREMASVSKGISSAYHEAWEEISPRQKILNQERSRDTGVR